jgi:hypothetical protein
MRFSTISQENRPIPPFRQLCGRFDSSAAAAKPIAAISMIPAKPHNTGV